jgi:hypothetical protein
MTLSFEDHAEYNIVTTNKQFIFVEDTGHNQFKTVTNDIENVLARLKEDFGIKNRRIFYKDSYDEIDEIIHKDGTFLRYKHGHAGYDIDMLYGTIPLPINGKKKQKTLDDGLGR